MMLFYGFILNLKYNWLGKHTLFFGPLGLIMRCLGGIPVNRTKKNDHVILLSKEIKSKLNRICNGMDVMSDKQVQMSDDIAKIKEAVYNPDQGLYARLRELESWKKTSSRMIWTLFTTVVGLIGAFILKNLGV